MLSFLRTHTVEARSPETPERRPPASRPSQLARPPSKRAPDFRGASRPRAFVPGSQSGLQASALGACGGERNACVNCEADPSRGVGARAPRCCLRGLSAVCLSCHSLSTAAHPRLSLLMRRRAGALRGRPRRSRRQTAVATAPVRLGIGKLAADPEVDSPAALPPCSPPLWKLRGGQTPEPRHAPRRVRTGIGQAAAGERPGAEIGDSGRTGAGRLQEKQA